MNKNSKLPAVLIISLILIFIETAGAYFSKSLALFGYSGLILAVSFSALPFITTFHGTKNDSFTTSQFRSILLNSIVLFILSILIINKAFLKLPVPAEISYTTFYYIMSIGFIGSLLCFLLILKERTFYKALSLKYLLAAFLAIFVIIVNTNYLDLYISIIFAFLMAAQAVILFIQSLKVLKNK